MAINKKLINFATRANFDLQLAKSNIDSKSIVFINDTQEIWTHGTFFSGAPSVKLQTSSPGTTQTGHLNISGNGLFGGKVGIGTTNPSYKLSVGGLATTGVETVANFHSPITASAALGNGAAISIGCSDGSYSTKIATIYEGSNPSYLQPSLAFFTMRNTYLAGSEVERMRISSGGNVGIGTTTPLSKLSINGGLHVGGDSDAGDNNILADGTITGLSFTGAGTGLTGTASSLSIGGNAATATTANNLKSNATTGLIQIVGPAAGTTRVMTLPNSNATLLYSGGALGTPSSGNLTNCTFPTLNQNTTGTSSSLSYYALAGAGGVAKIYKLRTYTASAIWGGVTENLVFSDNEGNAIQASLYVHFRFSNAGLTTLSSPTLSWTSGNPYNCVAYLQYISAGIVELWFSVPAGYHSTSYSIVNTFSTSCTVTVSNTVQASLLGTTSVTASVKTVAASLATARAINGVNFDGTSAITIAANANDVYAWAKAATKPSYTYSEIGGTVPTWNQNTTGNAATATKLASITTSFTGTYPVTFNVNGTIYSHTGITYTGSTNTLTATNFNGNASSATNADLLDGLEKGKIVYGSNNLTAVTSQSDITTAYRAGFYASNGVTTGYPAQGDSCVAILPYVGATSSYRYGVRIGGWSDIYHQLANGSGLGTWYKIWSERNFNPANYLPLTGGTLTGDVTVGNGIGQSILRLNNAPLDTNLASRIEFRSTDGQHIQLRANTHDTVRNPYGFHIEKTADNTQQTFKAYLSVEGDIVSGGNVTAPTFVGALTGNASSATALTTNAGSATRPIYFSGGKPVQGTYTFGNASGNIPISNGILNTNLNADLLDGENSSFFKKRYNVIIKKGTWSRILYATPIALSGSFMVSINYTRNSVVVGNVFLITFGHGGYGQITVLGTHGYTQIQARLTGDTNNIYLELFDEGSGTVGDTQTATITLDAINANITTYTSFTDGTTLSGSVKSLVSTVNNRINVDGRTVAFIDDDITGNASTASKVNNSLSLKFDTGTTEGTNLYTFNGSAAKTIDIKAGTNVTLTKAAGIITISSTDTNTVYTHPTTSGNKHIPSGGTSGQILRWSADGTATWGSDNNTTYNAATSSTLGLSKLFSNTVQSVAANTVTTTASRTYGVQVNSSGQLVVNVPWVNTDNNTTYSQATSSTLGLVKLGSDTQQTVAASSVTATASRSYAIQLNSSGQMLVNVPWTDNNTTYAAGTSSTLGLMKLFSNTVQSVSATSVSATASRTYGVQVNSSGQLVVNVPWTDSNTTYSNFTGATASVNGASGLVPAPTTANYNYFLKGTGSWTRVNYSDLGGTVPTWNQNTTGNAATVTIGADNSTNASYYPLFATAATGNLSPKTDTGLTYNPSTEELNTNKLTVADIVCTTFGSFSRLGVGTSVFSGVRMQIHDSAANSNVMMLSCGDGTPISNYGPSLTFNDSVNNVGSIKGVQDSAGSSWGALTFSTLSSGNLTEKVRINGAGQVSIATTDAEGYTLNVGGTVKCGQITSTAGSVKNGVTNRTTLSSMTTNLLNGGYLKLPSGIIMQYGRYNMGNGATTARFTFPVAFPTATVSVTLTVEHSDATLADPIKGFTKSTVDMNVAASSSSTRYVHITAFGY